MASTDRNNGATFSSNLSDASAFADSERIAP